MIECEMIFFLHWLWDNLNPASGRQCISDNFYWIPMWWIKKSLIHFLPATCWKNNKITDFFCSDVAKHIIVIKSIKRQHCKNKGQGAGFFFIRQSWTGCYPQSAPLVRRKIDIGEINVAIFFRKRDRVTYHRYNNTVMLTKQMM